MVLRWLCFALVWLLGSSVAQANKKDAAKLKRWKRLLKQGHALADQRPYKVQIKGANKLWKAYQLYPKKWKSLEAGARASIIRASLAKTKRAISMWGKTGWHFGKLMVRMKPKRAEGYVWSSMMMGHYARAGNIWRAIKNGFGHRITNMALESLKRNRKLYKGAAQRVLGRYYYRVPWPWRSYKKSYVYLVEANKLAPKNVQGIRYLAETSWALGKKSKARKLFRKCAKLWIPGLKPNSSSDRCRAWLKKNKR